MTISVYCLRCGLAWHVRGCTPETSANPEGAAEVRRDATDFWRKEPPWQGLAQVGQMPAPDETSAEFAARIGAPKPRSDLDTFRAMLEQSGVVAEYAEAADGTRAIGVKHARFLFDAAGKQRESRTFVAPPPTDLEVFRAMLERAGIDHDEVGTWEINPHRRTGLAIMIVRSRIGPALGSTFNFDNDGNLMRGE